MCKGNNNSNNSEREHDFNEHINDVKKNFSQLTKSVFDLTNDSLIELNDRAKGFSNDWFDYEGKDEKFNEFSKMVKGIMNRNNENWEFPSFYDSHPPEFFANGHNFKDLFGGSFKRGKTPYGLYSHRTPSIRNYNDCSEKNGESVWDSKGYWRCLFPNSLVPNEMLNYKDQHLRGEILTKEDFEAELKQRNLTRTDKQLDFGEKGVFFKQFEDFMNWKSIMYNNIKHERRLRRQNFRHNFENRMNSWSDKSQNDSGQVNSAVNSDDERKLTLSSIRSVMNDDTEKNETVFTEVKTECFSDGTSNTTTTTKTRPINGTTWSTVDEKVDTNSDKKGWFWN